MSELAPSKAFGFVWVMVEFPPRGGRPLVFPLLLLEAGAGVAEFPCSLDIVDYANVVRCTWNFDTVGIEIPRAPHNVRITNNVE